MAGSVRLRRQAAHEIEEHRRSQRIRRPRGALVYGVQEVQEAADYLRPDHTVPYGTVLSRDAVPGTSCQATIGCPYGTRLQTFRKQHLAKACCENVPEGRCDRSLARSAWDRCATPKEPSRRVRCDSCRCAHPSQTMSISL
jgi:hypothetical protein